jgi:feruloyl esterase
VATSVALLLTACGGGGDDPVADPLATNQTVANAASSCTALQNASIDASLINETTTGAVVTSASLKAAVPDAPHAGNTATVKGTPEYCQLLIDIKPIDPSAPMVKVQVNLPTTWNKRSLQLGGGGLNGTLVTGLGPARADGPELALPITRGFMTLGTDSGHVGSTGDFALNEEALRNYQYASYKKTRDVGVEVARRFYGSAPLKAYYIGGSEGGREGLLMAQRYPADFDGIVVVDPVIRLIGLWQYQLSMGTVQSAPGSWLGGKIQLVQDTVDAACDALDGIADRIVSNYKACKPLADAALAAKRCPSGADEGATCFSDGQLATLRWLQTGQTYAFPLANGLTSYPGYFYGSEAVVGGLDRWVVGTGAPTADPNAASASRSYNIGGTLVRYFVTKDLTANPLTFNANAWQSRLQALSNAMDMTNPDLSAFRARGGKIILRENLSDKGNAGQTGFDYYDAVVAKLGRDAVDQFFLAYGAAGLQHTTSRVEPGTANAPSYGTAGEIDLLGMIDDWVVKGTRPSDAPTLTLRKQLAPFDLLASRPMCRYGSYARYVGATPAGGNLASNYVCTAM